MKKIISLFFLFGSISSLQAMECPVEENTVAQMEQEILVRSKENKDIHTPLMCLVSLNKKSNGWVGYLAGQYLSSLMGQPIANNVQKSLDYNSALLKIQKEISNTSKLNQSFLNQWAKNEWSYYEVFCRPENQDGCQFFLPDSQNIQKMPQILAAKSVFLLRNAFENTQGNAKVKILNQIRELYEKTPKTKPLVKRALQEVLDEIDPVKMDLSFFLLT